MRSIQRLWDRMHNVPGLARDTLVLVALAVTGIASGGYIFSQYGMHAPWSEQYTFSAEFANASGVRPESNQEVRIAGVPVGKIESAEPTQDGNARLKMSLEPGHTVYSNARLVLRTKTPVNIMYIALEPGGPPGKPLPEGGTIPVSRTERPVLPYEVLNKLDQRTQTALTSLLNQADVALANAPARLPGGLRATDAALSTFRPVVEQLETRRNTIAELVTALSQISSAAGRDNERMARLTGSLQQTLSVLASRDEELSATLRQLPGLTGDLNEAMTSAGALTSELNPALRELRGASGRLPGTLSRLRGTVHSAGTLIAEAKPVVRKAKPVLADLRPLSGDVSAALGDLAPVTGHLPSATRRIVPWMNDLAAFVYQTSSAFSLADVNGGVARANLTVDVRKPTGAWPTLGVGPSNGGTK